MAAPLVALGLVTAAAAAPASSLTGVVARAHVSQPGTYRVTVTLASRSPRPSTVTVTIGRLEFDVRTAPERSSTISVKLTIAADTLTVRAVERTSRPRVHVALRLIRASAQPPPAQAPPQGSTSPPTPIGEPGSWHLIFDDEFNGGQLDTSRWSTGWFGSGITGPLSPNELECYDPAQVAVAGGELDLHMVPKPESCGGRTRPYAGAIVTTNGKFEFTYGFTEVRAYLTGSTVGSGGAIPDWPDIWTDGHNWPTDGENDIMEGLGGHACWHFHSPGNAPGACARRSFTNGWHTFAADWEPGSVTYYYDGRRVGTIRQGITAAAMYLLISLGADHSNGGPLGPATVRVDYVRVWQH